MSASTCRQAVENVRFRAPLESFPKFLLPRAAGRPRKLKFKLSKPSPTLARVVGRVWKSGTPGGRLHFPGPHLSRKWRVKRPPTVPVLEIRRNKYKNRGGTEFTLYRNNVGPLCFATESPNKLDDLSKRWVALGATLDGRLNSP